LLIFVGLAGLLVAAVGLVRQRISWTRVIATRRDAGFLLLASLGLLVVGALLDPSPKKVAVSSASDVSAPAATDAVMPSPAEPATSAPAVATAIPSPRAESSRPLPTYSPVTAYTAPAPVYSTPKAYTAPPVATEPTTGAYNGGGTTDTYTNVDGNQVERPDGSSSGASAQCRDGTYSHSQHRSGTCSGHGGVAQWLNP
jgi:hypothetical protein